MPAKESRPTCYFRLTMGGAEEAAAFKKLSGIASKTEAMQTWTVDANGRPKQTTIAGRTTWTPITLERVADENLKLWEWRQEVIEKGPTGARKVCTIEQLDYAGDSIAKYELTDAWPSNYSASPMAAGENAASCETIELVHDGCKRL